MCFNFLAEDRNYRTKEVMAEFRLHQNLIWFYSIQCLIAVLLLKHVVNKFCVYFPFSVCNKSEQ